MNTKLAGIINVAWNNSVKKVAKISFNETIDVQFGVYTGEEYPGWLTINLKPSKGGLDWFINLFGYLTPPMRLDGGWVHRGYWKEIEYHWPGFRDAILKTPELLAAMKEGVIISGRSKGAAEAALIAYRLWYPRINIVVGAIEPPLCVSYQLSKQIENCIGKDNILWTCYKNDIVPGVPKWFEFPGIKYQLGDRRLGLSIKDHHKATTDDSIFYDYIKRMLP